MQDETSAAEHDASVGYVYVWEFAVFPGRESDFIRYYGPQGIWAQLFRKSPGYIGTLLLQDGRQPHRYLTVDRWRTQAEHDAFLARFRQDYQRVDKECEALSSSERELGSYWEV